MAQSAASACRLNWSFVFALSHLLHFLVFPNLMPPLILEMNYTCTKYLDLIRSLVTFHLH